MNLRDFGQRLIPTCERSGLQTRIVTTENVLLCAAAELLTAFLELEAAIRTQLFH